MPLHAGVLMLFSGGLPSFRNTLRFLMHCLLKGLYFKDLVLSKDLFGILGPYLYFRVLIFTILVSFMQRMSYLQALVPDYTVGKF